MKLGTKFICYQNTYNHSSYTSPQIGKLYRFNSYYQNKGTGYYYFLGEALCYHKQDFMLLSDNKLVKLLFE